MNSKIDYFIEKKLKSISLHPESDQNALNIHIWYCDILSILRTLFDMENNPYFAEDYNILQNKTIHGNDFSINFLSGPEIAALNKFKSFKKQIEWLSGRFLLKVCLSCFVDDFMGYNAKKDKSDKLNKIYIDYEKEGAPFLSDFPGYRISLSHSGGLTGFAVCLNKDKNIGIDIEKFRKKPDENFLKIAFTQKERDNLDGTMEDVLKNWTRKEAFLKYIKKGFNEDLHKVEIIGNKVLHNNNDAKVRIYSEIINNNYMFSIVY